VARLEGQVVLTALAERFSELEPACELDVLRIHPNISLRGYETFPLKLGPDSRVT
jgi:cytochrome P450